MREQLIVSFTNYTQTNLHERLIKLITQGNRIVSMVQTEGVGNYILIYEKPYDD